MYYSVYTIKNISCIIMLYKIKKVKKLNANERLEVKEGAKNEQYKPYSK